MTQDADDDRAPMHPFSEEEIEHIAAFASIDPAKVRGIAWLTVLKARQQAREDTDRMMREVFARPEHIDGGDASSRSDVGDGHD